MNIKVISLDRDVILPAPSINPDQTSLDVIKSSFSVRIEPDAGAGVSTYASHHPCIIFNTIHSIYAMFVNITELSSPETILKDRYGAFLVIAILYLKMIR